MTLEVVAERAEDEPSRRAAVNSELRLLERRDCEHRIAYCCQVGAQQVEARVCSPIAGRVEVSELVDCLLLIGAESFRRDEYISDIFFEERLIEGFARPVGHEEDE